MDSHFERPNEERSELSPDFRKVLEDKASEAINKLVGQKIERYFQASIDKTALETVAAKVFEMLLEGRSEQEILAERQKLLREAIDAKTKSKP